MNATDYVWFKKSRISEAYCLTFVRGLSAVEALSRIDGEQVGRVTGLREFTESLPDEHGGRRWYLGATELGGWTLLVEDNGFLGVTEEVIAPLSAGTQVVSHYKNVNAVDRFSWMVDGDMRLTFEPLFAYDRAGSDPDGQVEVMEAVGFDLRAGEDRDYTLHTEAAFALAEHLTGVRLTAELLESADYLCALAPLKG
ncbi:DUF6461 domain-containing protein [Kribbella sp. NPDC023855]|uniref:DUF6461 domain-containing protein n=1 Tax=Kribbella sp. NPDC023855 TaxID=3154698 RepID=UPI0033D8B190